MAQAFHQFKVKGDTYEYETSYSSTRHGFAHHCTLFCNGVKVATATTHYLNRTWERYTYESVIHAAINNYFTSLADIAVDKWKLENNRTRISKEQRDKISTPFGKVGAELRAKIDKKNLGSMY